MINTVNLLVMRTRLRALYHALSAGGTDVPFLSWQCYNGTRERKRIGQVNLIYRKPKSGREVLIIRGGYVTEVNIRVTANVMGGFSIDHDARVIGVSCRNQEQAERILINLCCPYLKPEKIKRVTQPNRRPEPKSLLARIASLFC